MALESGHKVVVSRRVAGFGDLLVSLSSAWRYAQRANRTLVIDWRRSLYLKDRARNAFPVFFEPPSAIDGVPVICADSARSLGSSYSALSARGKLRPFLVKLSYIPPLRNIPQVAACRTAVLHQARRDEVRLVTSGRDLPDRTVLLQSCLQTELSNSEICQRFLDHIKPVEEIRQEIDQFANVHFRGKRVVSVHVRHANGADIDDNHVKYWADESVAITKICSAVQRIRDKLGGDCLIFICTDVARILQAIKSSLDNVVTREKSFLLNNQGELHTDRSTVNRDGTKLGRDAVVEMFLLARGDGLVCYPPGSYFSFYARYCRNGPKLRETESLQM